MIYLKITYINFHILQVTVPTCRIHSINTKNQKFRKKWGYRKKRLSRKKGASYFKQMSDYIDLLTIGYCYDQSFSGTKMQDVIKFITYKHRLNFNH